jgi:hypothetical protein
MSLIGRPMLQHGSSRKGGHPENASTHSKHNYDSRANLSVHNCEMLEIHLLEALLGSSLQLAAAVTLGDVVMRDPASRPFLDMSTSIGDYNVKTTPPESKVVP